MQLNRTQLLEQEVLSKFSYSSSLLEGIGIPAALLSISTHKKRMDLWFTWQARAILLSPISGNTYYPLVEAES